MVFNLINILKPLTMSATKCYPSTSSLTLVSSCVLFNYCRLVAAAHNDPSAYLGLPLTSIICDSTECLNIFTWRQFSKLWRIPKYSFHIKTNFNVAKAISNHHQPIKQLSKFRCSCSCYTSLYTRKLFSVQVFK